MVRSDKDGVYYETGEEVPEVLGSGSTLYNVITTKDETFARSELKNADAIICSDIQKHMETHIPNGGTVLQSVGESSWR